MVEAVWQVLHSPPGVAAAISLKAGVRAKPIRWDLGGLLPFECEVPDPQGRPFTHQVTFTAQEQRQAGRLRTTCVIVIEGRERAGTTHLQIVTAYPAVSKAEIESLLQLVRRNDAYRRR